jgi:tRNA-splicing ligase RtcB (3'-phosphate/5'-hydroxy nucleic acid ligase)
MISGNDLKNIGFAEGKALGLALDLMEQNYAHLTFDDKLTLLKQILNNPSSFINDATLAPIAAELLRPVDETIALNVDGKSYQIYGAEAIEQGALQQMETAMKLPVTIAGALMPDAHQGYGLPIGGVLATNNAVIPYGVGVDIGCRMCMTLYNMPPGILEEKKDDFKKLLMNNTQFGRSTFKRPKDHEIFERKEFSELQIVREMKDRAWQQIGSSGGGNHFVEFGIVEILSPINEYNIAPGKYVAVLSHSGSR